MIEGGLWLDNARADNACAQIIAEGAKTPDSSFPLDILRQMVIASGRAGQESALRYTKAMLDLYSEVAHRGDPAAGVPASLALSPSFMKEHSALALDLELGATIHGSRPVRLQIDQRSRLAEADRRHPI